MPAGHVTDLWRGGVCPAVAGGGEAGRAGSAAEQIVGDEETEEAPLLAGVVRADAEHLGLGQRHEGQAQALLQQHIAGAHAGLQP